MKQRNSRSETRRAERDTADRRLRERANKIMTDPAAVVEILESVAATSKTPKMLRYSLRNQILLTIQAAEREMWVTDVDSYEGWVERGQRVRRGERGLRIVAPTGRPRTTDDIDNSPQEEQTNGEPEPAVLGPVRFRMISVFDISQTDPDPSSNIIKAHPHVENPAAILTAALADQIQRFGYTIAMPAAVVVKIDDATRTVHLPRRKTVSDLAFVLATLHSKAKQTHTSTTNADTAAS